jgi:hypothetical protein
LESLFITDLANRRRFLLATNHIRLKAPRFLEYTVASEKWKNGYEMKICSDSESGGYLVRTLATQLKSSSFLMKFKIRSRFIPAMAAAARE